jgi:VIT1/CCC1 family predicted Fe2+/Mn2+ transporter
MPKPRRVRSAHHESHLAHRIGWLRAAVLGANDGIVSVASLLMGVAAGGRSRTEILLAGVASLVAGAMSMAAGEYVSVKSQADSEEADLALERRELTQNPERELEELVGIYVERGLDEPLARKVAKALTAFDALGVHARDEIGITDMMRARPVQAAAASAASFAVGALLPMVVAWLSPEAMIPYAVAATTLVALAGLGAVAARAGGAPALRGAIRVTLWGMAAMAITAVAGLFFGGAA